MIKTLLYSDIFNYPLTAREIFQNNIESSASEQEVIAMLEDLCKHGIVYQQDFLFSLHAEKDHRVYESRFQKNKRAVKYKKRGKQISRFISYFPYVRAVFLSGSISKDCMEADGDIDYFIVTSPNRLWVARTLLILFKKIALFNSYKFFCLNYFIDTDHLEISEKNIYTATEIITLIPTFGKESCAAFMKSNRWAKAFRPNFPERELSGIGSSRPSQFKKAMEWTLSGRAGDWLETKFLNVTTRFWKRKFSNFSGKDYELSIKSRKHLSQINPENFQKRVLLAYEEKVKAFEKRYMVFFK